MGKPAKLFREIAEEWEKRNKDEEEFYDFLNEYIEINDDQRSYTVKRRKKGPEFV